MSYENETELKSDQHIRKKNRKAKFKSDIISNSRVSRAGMNEQGKK